jgi:hypothetical protein
MEAGIESNSVGEMVAEGIVAIAVYDCYRCKKRQQSESNKSREVIEVRLRVGWQVGGGKTRARMRLAADGPGDLGEWDVFFSGVGASP